MGVIRVVLTDLDGVIRRWPATQFSSVEDAYGLPRGCMAPCGIAAALGLVSNATTRLAGDLSRLSIAGAFDFIVKLVGHRLRQALRMLL